MLLESFLPNLALFVAGQLAAWFYLRTGRLWIGSVAMAALWIAADWALVAKYVFADTGPSFRWSVMVMQVTAAVTVLALLFAQWRRRWSATAKRRAALYGEAMQQYLSGKHDQAAVGFRRLVRCDPWDAASWLAFGNALRRLDRAGAARRCYRRCRRVDGSGEYLDLAKAMAAAPRRTAPPPAPAASATAGSPKPSAAPPRPAGS